MTTNLSIELLRSFVAIVELGSMQKATERVFLSQSALSLQIRRLEEIVRQPLFRRDGTRRLAITPAGTELLAYAREMLALNDRAVSALQGTRNAPVRIGVVQAFAETLLPGILQEFSAAHPSVPLEIRVAGSSELLQAWQDGHLDLALSATGNSDTGTIGHAPACWIGAARLAQDNVVPLVLLPEPCAFRAMALQALTRSGVQYRIAVETPNLASLYAAVSAGLGITCRPRALSGADQGEVIDDDALPALPEVNYVLSHSAGHETPSGELAEMFRAAFARPRAPASARRPAGSRLRA